MSKTSGLLTDAILIGLVTFVAYISAYSFKYYYFTYFGLPGYLIDISLTDLLSTSVFAVVVLLSCLSIVHYLVLFRNIKIGKKSKHFLLFFIILLVVFIPFLLGAINHSYPWESVIFAILVLAVITTVAYTQAFIAYDNEHTQDATPTAAEILLEPVREKFGMFPIISCTILVVFFFDSIAMGKFWAKNQSYFFIPNSTENVAIIGRNDEGMIGVLYDAEKHTFARELKFLRYEELASTTIFSIKKIGPLRNPEDTYWTDFLR